MTLKVSDLEVGKVLPLGPYRVARDELLSFASEFDPQPFHLDETAANNSVLQGLATSGWHTSSILMRMICDAFFLKVNAIGSTGIEEMKWVRPVYVDDILSGQLTVTGVRRSKSKPDRLIVNFVADMWDQTRTAKARMSSMVFIQDPQP
jgi:acyl dehydratase